MSTVPSLSDSNINNTLIPFQAEKMSLLGQKLECYQCSMLTRVFYIYSGCEFVIKSRGNGVRPNVEGDYRFDSRYIVRKMSLETRNRKFVNLRVCTDLCIYIYINQSMQEKSCTNTNSINT